MVKIKVTLLFFVLLYLVACHNEGINEEKSVLVEESKPFDELEYLERHNSEDFIYKGTKSYLKIVESEDYQQTETRIDADYLYDIMKSGFDSTFYSIKHDTLFFYRVRFIGGRCSPKFLTQVVFKKNEAFIISQEIETGNVSIIEKDTNIYIDGCELRGAFEFRFKIPLSKLENTEHLYFKGQEIKFK